MEWYSHIHEEDPELHEALVGEEKRQAEGLELIPSEIPVSRWGKEAMDSSVYNKNSER
jgi:glycine/serine hydroxymethyltransferase